MAAVARLQHRALRPKVLSNKQLSKQVRTIKNSDGIRFHDSNLLYSAVTLTAGTPDINYFQDAASPTLFSIGIIMVHSYYDCHFKLLTTNAAGATVRLLYGFDERFDGTNLTAAQIIDTTTDSASGYVDGVCVNHKEARKKNRDKAYRGVIVKDMLIPLIANEPKCFNLRLPLFNRKTYAESADNRVKFQPFMLALADEGNVTFSMGVDYYRNSISG